MRVMSPQFADGRVIYGLGGPRCGHKGNSEGRHDKRQWRRRCPILDFLTDRCAAFESAHFVRIMDIRGAMKPVRSWFGCPLRCSKTLEVVMI
jgi:hypothetical protein